MTLCLLTVCPTDRLSAQFIQPEDRALITDFSVVTALAATQTTLYAATPAALVLYDRAMMRLRGTVSVMDGYPPGGAIAMAANPLDDTVWLAAPGQWLLFRPFARVWESGPLPGRAQEVVIDRDDQAGGAWFRTSLGWYFVDRAGMSRAGSPPPPARRIGSLGGAELRRAAPAIDVALADIARDERLRRYDVTAAAASPFGDALYVATNGNGTFRLDPAGHRAERFPAGLLAPGAGSLALAEGRVCAGSDRGVPAHSYAPRAAFGRRGVSCFTDDLADDATFEAPLSAVVGGRVTAVAVTRGGVWAGSEEGLSRLDETRPARLTTAQGLPANDVRALAADTDGVWVGTSLGVAFVTDAERPRVRDAVRVGAAVGALLLYRDTLWLGTAAGLAAWPPGSGDPVAALDGLALRAPIVDLATSGDTIIAATDRRVLWRVHGSWSDAGAGTPAAGSIAAIAAGDDGLWVAGSGGIAHLAPRAGSWITFTSPRDIPAPVRDIAVRGRYVWLATPLGLVRIERRALAR